MQFDLRSLHSDLRNNTFRLDILQQDSGYLYVALLCFMYQESANSSLSHFAQKCCMSTKIILRKTV